MTNKKIQRALCELNGYIDDDRQRLCDKIKCLEYWHKKLTRDLRHVLEIFDEVMSKDYELRHKYSLEMIGIWQRDITPPTLNRTERS